MNFLKLYKCSNFDGIFFNFTIERLFIRVHDHEYEEEVVDHTPPITSEKVRELELMSLNVMINRSLVI